MYDDAFSGTTIDSFSLLSSAALEAAFEALTEAALEAATLAAGLLVAGGVVMVGGSSDGEAEFLPDVEPGGRPRFLGCSAAAAAGSALPAAGATPCS